LLTHEQNDRLTRIEGDAPMGRLMREHFWIPAVLSAQLEADGAPRRVRLLGTDHVAFRATDGRVGFFAEACPHRGCSLVLARNEDCGLRCIFHGWKIDVGGFVAEAPTHQPDPQAFAAKVPVTHYPVHEGGGIVWVWLGSTPAPVFPELPFTVLREPQVWVTVTKAYCNWLQGVEATLDSAHVGTLHETYITRWSDTGDKPLSNALEALAPRYDVKHTRYGLEAIALRPLPDGSTYLRTSTWFAPFVTVVPGSGGPHSIFIASPIDDTHHNLFYGAFSDDDINDGIHAPEFVKVITGDRPYDPSNFGGFSGSREENYGQDRDAMRRGHFSGFTGNLIQEDMVTQASMGPIVDRTKEHLSSADVAVIHARRLLLSAIDDMESGRPVVGSGPGMDHRDVFPADAILPGPSPDVLARA
jgi:phenylpropionate dioxygenase-like ring-hydroxylating dioxygenase large terminal subunit